MTSLFGFLLLGLFFGTWMGSVIIIPLPLVLALVYGNYYPLYFVIVYMSYRFFFPRKAWPALHGYLADVCQRHRYFRTQKTVFENGLIEPNTKSMLAVHPHGILCCGWSLNLNMSADVFKGRFFFMGTDVLFSLPFISDMLTWYGCGPVDKKTMVSKMKTGENLALIPGGFQEATLYKRGEHRVYIKNRKGFIKYALQHGYNVHPTYNFGEEHTYLALTWLQEKLVFLNQYKIPAVVFLGKYLWFLPNDEIDMISVIGKPVELPTIENPTREDVDKWHAVYVDALVKLFETNKAKYCSNPNAELIVM